MRKLFLLILFITSNVYGQGELYLMNQLQKSSFDMSEALGYYPLQTDANDAISTHDGTVVGGVIQNGVHGPAFYCDGQGDYISIPDNDVFSFGDGTTDQPFTIGCQVLFDDIGESHFFLNKRGSGHEWAIRYHSGEWQGAIYSLGNSNNRRNMRQSSSPPTGTWLNIALTSDGSTLTMVYNGTSIGSHSTTGSYVAMSNGSQNPVIGAYGGSLTSSSLGLDGAIRKVYIFGKHMTVAEIQEIEAIHNAGGLLTD